MTNTIEFRRVLAGYYILFIDGIERPVKVLRDGKTWVVQAADLHRHSALEDQRVGFRTLHFAKTVAIRVWEIIRTARNLAEHDAYEMNARIVYVEGHGTRAYNLTDVVRYDDGTLCWSVRPLSGGMEWSYDRERFGTKPF